MRRFIKTYTVRRHVQYTVVQDGAAGTFTLIRWRATSLALEPILTLCYSADDPGSLQQARGAAITEARRLAGAGLTVSGDPAAAPGPTSRD